jgi:hypothetical protein
MALWVRLKLICIRNLLPLAKASGKLAEASGELAEATAPGTDVLCR